MSTTHHTDTHRHSHPLDAAESPLRASQALPVPRHWTLRAGIAVAAVVLAAVSLAYGSNDDASSGRPSTVAQAR